jgi:hypothetical protein
MQRYIIRKVSGEDPADYTIGQTRVEKRTALVSGFFHAFLDSRLP